MATENKTDFAADELSSFAYMFWGRCIALAIVAIWFVATVPWERSPTYLSVVALFLVTGAIPFGLARSGYRSSVIVVMFLFLDAAILSFLIIVPNPYDFEAWPPQMNLRTQAFLYIGLFLAYMSLSYKPILVVWAGIAATICWSTGYFWVINLPETRVFTGQGILDSGLTLETAFSEVLHPMAVGIPRWTNQIIFLSALTFILALAVWRSRRLVHRRVVAEAQRSALSRYFSPNVVQQLTSGDSSLNKPKVQPVAVLFADMVGFTAISEQLKPSELLDLLRGFHGRLARCAIQHGGTIDKYIGDAIMVHFGTPETRFDDPVRAIRCVADMKSEIEAWNKVRLSKDLDAVEVGIGIHYGDVVVGNIGDAQRLEYTVLGDTVNVAARLESTTRDLKAVIVASHEIIEAASAQGLDCQRTLPGLTRGRPVQIRGRVTPVELWHLSR
ncbi:MAG: adenylate/guanylate cyclase domain-containing protein [Pseudomonadota bacterium]